MNPENWFKKVLIWSLYIYPTAPNPPTTPTNKTPAKRVPLNALSPSNPSSASLPSPLTLSSPSSPQEMKSLAGSKAVVKEREKWRRVAI
ncbi:hypothetical protein OIU77_015250 [Salix suchowensis]|uniref:Uncharacterized protein n=1 Tax=Salix suchowensis TaxID=1278906 RepID=A0ABQ8ZS88_9ROSI|nr:hypothetical protein OIU77_015250 [Salix suchowensis]